MERMGTRLDERCYRGFGLVNFELIHNSPRPVVEGNYGIFTNSLAGGSIRPGSILRMRWEAPL